MCRRKCITLNEFIRNPNKKKLVKQIQNVKITIKMESIDQYNQVTVKKQKCFMESVWLAEWHYESKDVICLNDLAWRTRLIAIQVTLKIVLKIYSNKGSWNTNCSSQAPLLNQLMADNDVAEEIPWPRRQRYVSRSLLPLARYLVREALL